MNDQTNTSRTDSMGFEIETCSRCGGTGNYSYCQMHGTRCFKCSGKKDVLTKRGLAALEFYRGLSTKTADQIVPGDVIWSEAGPFSKGFWSTVVEARWTRTDGTECCTIGKDGQRNPFFMVKTDRDGGGKFGPITMTFRLAQTAEQKAANLALAMEYQAGLTKAGKPRKTAGKAS
jgi:hypothetical protein